MKNLKVLTTKYAVGVYISLAVILATAFGFGEVACNTAEIFEIEVEVCQDAIEQVE